jgi:hypothetical protein
VQPLAPLGGKGKGRTEINVSTTDVDGRQNSPSHYKSTEASNQFKQVRFLDVDLWQEFGVDLVVKE